MLCCCTAKAQQDTALLSQLMDAIAKEQVQQTSKDFYAGLFPCYRTYGGSPHNYQPDNTIFYTAIGVFALKNMLPYLDEVNRHKAETVIDKATAIYPVYRNKYGLPFYSFWGNKDKIMPKSFIIQYLKNVFGQSEDVDDSVMILMGLDNNDSDNALIKTRMLETSNLAVKKYWLLINGTKIYRLTPPGSATACR